MTIFSDRCLEKLNADSDFDSKIIFGNDARLQLHDYIKKQNIRYWTASKPMCCMYLPYKDRNHRLIEEEIRRYLEKKALNWPLKCCDRTPLNFFLCSYQNWRSASQKLYTSSIPILSLKFPRIWVEMGSRDVKNWVQRKDCCKRAHGGLKSSFIHKWHNNSFHMQSRTLQYLVYFHFILK